MRIMIHRKSAPHMKPIVSDEMVNTPRETILDLLSGIGERISSLRFYVDGVPTFIRSDDISYAQLIEDPS